MLKRLLKLLLFLSLSIFLFADLEWYTDYETAISLSKQNDKLLLINFTGSDWCIWCHNLYEEVFSQKDFQSYAADHFILLYVDFPEETRLSQKQRAHNEALARKYAIQGFPTIVIANSKGDELVRSGYLPGGSVQYIEHIESLINSFFDSSTTSEVDAVGNTWYSNLEHAVHLAELEEKTVFVYFTASDWCAWCKRLNDEILLQDYFATFANENLILVKFDFPSTLPQPEDVRRYNQSKAQQYSIQGYPTVILLDSKGRQLAQTGYMTDNVENYIRTLEDYILYDTKNKLSTSDLSGIVWFENLSYAESLAKKEGKQILILFYPANFGADDWVQKGQDLKKKMQYSNFHQFTEKYIPVLFNYENLEKQNHARYNYLVQQAIDFNVEQFPHFFIYQPEKSGLIPIPYTTENWTSILNILQRN